MAAPPDPLELLLATCRRIGNEFCWPARLAVEVVGAFESLGLVVLGAELWRFDDDSEQPTVVGWTSYTVPDGDWGHRVAAGSRHAADELIGYVSDQTSWVNLIWEAPVDGS